MDFGVPVQPFIWMVRLSSLELLEQPNPFIRRRCPYTLGNDVVINEWVFLKSSSAFSAGTRSLLRSGDTLN